MTGVASSPLPKVYRSEQTELAGHFHSDGSRLWMRNALKEYFPLAVTSGAEIA